MFKKIKEVFQNKIKENEIKEKKMKANPNSTETKEYLRKIGIKMLLIGFVPAAVFYWEWAYSDSFFIIFPIIALVLWGFGFYVLLTGKFPKA